MPPPAARARHAPCCLADGSGPGCPSSGRPQPLAPEPPSAAAPPPSRRRGRDAWAAPGMHSRRHAFHSNRQAPARSLKQGGSPSRRSSRTARKPAGQRPSKAAPGHRAQMHHKHRGAPGGTWRGGSGRLPARRCKVLQAPTNLAAVNRQQRSAPKRAARGQCSVTSRAAATKAAAPTTQGPAPPSTQTRAARCATRCRPALPPP